MRSLENDNWWMFSRNQFLDRKYKMQELYQNHMEGDDVTSVGQVSSSFDPVEGDTVLVLLINVLDTGHFRMMTFVLIKEYNSTYLLARVFAFR